MMQRFSRIVPRLGARSFCAQSKLGQPAKLDPGVTVGQLETKLFIDGQYRDSVTGKTFATYDPRDESVITEFACAQPADIDIAVDAARKAFDEGPWPRMGGFARGRVLEKIADKLEENRDLLARIETWDNGKPVGIANAADMTLAIECFRYYAGWADKIQGKTIPNNTTFGKFFSYTLHEPIGVCASIIPWNFPLLMAAWKIAPALCCGNTTVIKSAETTPLTSLFFGKLAAEAGLPDGVVNIVPGLGEEAGAHLAGHKKIDKLGFTGETGTGTLVMQAAAANLIPVTMELGGKSPAIVAPDADVDNAVAMLQVGLFLNAGQCCCASSRIYVHESVYDEFVEKTVRATEARKVGDPFSLEGGGMDQGPQQNRQQFEKVESYIGSGKAQGASLLAGGNRIGDKGFYVQSTVFGDVQDSMTIAQEEIFGPVMQISKYSHLDDAIRRANDTEYGLGAAVFSKNVDTINTVVRSLKSGTVWVNCYDVFDSSIPFGGFKKSGFGREKSEYSLQNFLQVKAVTTALPNGADGTFY